MKSCQYFKINIEMKQISMLFYFVRVRRSLSNFNHFEIVSLAINIRGPKPKKL